MPRRESEPSTGWSPPASTGETAPRTAEWVEAGAPGPLKALQGSARTLRMMTRITGSQALELRI